MDIRILPSNIANMIAAGEVVQRPASVVKELVENAVDAGADQITVRIQDAGRTLIQVIDNGCGMSEEVQRRVTDPFYTTRTTRKVGMGLPLLKMAAEQTGGSLSITSSVKEGESGTALVATFDTKSIATAISASYWNGGKTACIVYTYDAETSYTIFVNNNEVYFGVSFEDAAVGRVISARRRKGYGTECRTFSSSV